MTFEEFCKKVDRLIKRQNPLSDQTIHLKRRVPHGEIEIMIGYVSPEFASEGEIISHHGIKVADFLDKDAEYWDAQMAEIFNAMMREMTETDCGYKLEDLLGASDVARLLGWDVRKVSVYGSSGRSGFPTPVGQIGKRPVWYKGDIVRFKSQHRG